jgi:hypothetical protein
MTPMVQSHVSSMQSAGAILSELIDSFGFYPENSLIIRWMKQDEVVLVQRCDITAFLSPEGLVESDLEIYIEPGRAYNAEKAAIVVCLESMDSRIHTAIQVVESAIVNAEISMAQVFIAVDQRMYARECLGTCDAHFIRIDTGVKRVDRALECAINPSRLINVKEFPELPEPGKLGVWRAIESQFVQGLMKQTVDLIKISDCARLAVALGDIRVRDSILWDMAHGAFDRNFLAKTLTGLLPQLEVSHGAPIATSAAICWWLNGNGAMANLCLDRALTDAPEYSLAAMVRSALDHALPPEFWLESINELTREQCLAGLDVALRTSSGYSSP